MRAYLASLERLLQEDVAIFAPGHGYLIGEPHRELRRLVQHRLKREGKVRDAIGRLGAPTLEEMLPLVYDDVPPRVHGAAARSLTAHLQKLLADGELRVQEGRYSFAR
jgi:glyoxylase-like metal-dependent hydrolase (beta-lactamase superfamily II)